MKAKIDAVREGPCPKRYEVDFSSRAGAAVAAWHGERKPEVGEIYDVEMELPGDYEWGRSIRVADEDSSSEIKRKAAGTTLIYGCLESLDEDMVAVVRVSESLVFVDTKNPNGVPIARKKIVIETPLLMLYETHI